MSNPDQGSLNQLLQWGITNSDTSQQSAQDGQAPRDPRKGLDPKMLAALLGGPSDADLMREAMVVITATPEESNLENKLIAWDNLEQLVEQIDNANNMEALKLWTPLLEQLQTEEAECRMYAAWVISTAVQNNVRCQEKLLALGGVQSLLDRVMQDDDQKVRKKAATALSSEVRNFQPAFDELVEKLPKGFLTGADRLDAADMEQVNSVVDALRRRAADGA
ncbi:hypothetical protein AMS68_007033 [Peltaster fructicola]|uniref:Nucleotide exchange factor Fes1 domain-containing protein n=1 Tax=Peltaster fructicola TaxID=286661 RepID=A0A6H0Y3I8_9PEZI|nr:hypothetical protein AMS68_007033 [Peltaster fructicola]